MPAGGFFIFKSDIHRSASFKQIVEGRPKNKTKAHPAPKAAREGPSEASVKEAQSITI
jgi:hypothetical protein